MNVNYLLMYFLFVFSVGIVSSLVLIGNLDKDVSEKQKGR